MLNFKHSHKLSAKLKFSSKMGLELQILEMPINKLKELVDQELEENPLLEIADDVLIEKTKNVDEYIEFEDSVQDSSFSSNEDYHNKQDYIKSLISYPETLQDHLLHQLHSFDLPSDEYNIGESIIGSINDDGFLRYSIEEIAGSINADVKKVEEALSLIQTFDPAGAGSRDLRECLLIQLKAKGKEDALSYKIIDKYLDILKKKDFNKIAKELVTSIENVRDAFIEISSLEPKPGRSFCDEKAGIIIPDASLKEKEDGYEIIMNTRALPKIDINENYKQILKDKDASGDVIGYLREGMAEAKFFINAIKRRRETIKDIIEAIVIIQKDFFDKGAEALKPMTLEDIADKIGKNKSTVSRAIHDKYLDTPCGLIELKYFFNSSIKQTEDTNTTKEAVKLKITELIENEDKSKPLSDLEIADCLKKEQIIISRRAVTKYRRQLNILPSNLRKE